MLKTSTALVAAGAALVALLAAGCGAEQVDPRAAVLEASSATADAGSSRLEFDVTMTIAGEEASYSGGGAFDYEGRRGRLTYDMSALFETLPGVPPDAFGDGTVELVYDGTVIYLGYAKGSTIEQQLGKRWLKIDLGDLDDAAGLDLGALMQLNQSPADQLRLLQAASDEVEELGREEVRGTETTHYRAEVDLARALDATLDEAGLPEDERRALAEQLQALQDEAFVEGPIPIELWIDDEGRLRRYSMRMTMAPAGEETRMSMTMELFDFGAAVDVEPPPARDVFDLAHALPPEGLS